MDDFDLDLSLDAKPRKPKKAQGPKYAIAPEEEQSLLGQLGGAALSGLAWVGEGLDKYTGSRAVRGLLGGKPRELASIIPFSDDLGITRREDRVTGKDLTGWDDPDSWWDDAAGIGTEMVLDPTLYFNPLAWGKGLHAISKAGFAVDDVAKLLGKGAVEGTLAHTGDDAVKALIQRGGTAAEKTGAAAGGRAVDPLKRVQNAIGGADAWAEVADKPMRHLGSFGLPFMDPIFETNFGLSSQTVSGIGKNLDQFGDAIRYSTPMKYAHELFNADVAGTRGEIPQRVIEPVEAAREARHYEVRQPLLYDKPLFEGIDDGQIWRWREGVEAPPTPEIADAIARWRSADDVAREAVRARGGDVGDVEFINNFASRDTGRAGYDPQHAGRRDYTQNIVGGTDMLNQIYKSVPGDLKDVEDIEKFLFDKYVTEWTQPNAMGPAKPEHTSPFSFPLDNPWNYLETTYTVPTQAQAAKPAVHPFQDRISKVAKSIADASPEARAMGPYRNNPLVDHMRHQTSMVDLEGRMGSFQEGIAQAMKRGTQDPAALTGREVLEKAGRFTNKARGKLRPEAVKGIAAMAGLNPKDVLTAKVDPAVASELLGYLNRTPATEELHPLVQGYDDLTQLFKAGVLTHPARYVRDFTSGQAQGVLAGMNPLNWPSMLGEATGILGGGNASRMSDPAVLDVLAARGITNPTPEQYTNALRSILGAADIGHGMTSEVASAAKGLNELDRPGDKPYGLENLGGSLGKAASGFSPAKLFTEESAFSPAIKGVGGREQTLNATVAGASEVGQYIDDLNRVPSMLDQLGQGVDPTAAANSVRQWQVDYAPQNFTDFERNWMKRAAPFYSFAKGNLANTARELVQHPSGRMAKLIRAQEALTRNDGDDFVPEHVRNTMALPVPSPNEGFDRYITGLGLMPEDALGLVRPRSTGYHTIQDTLQGLAGRLNPMLKAPFEIAAGTQMFSGRDLEDLDPNLGRLYSNVIETTTGQKVSPLETPILLEQALAASPASRLISSARTLTDPRKDIGTKALNLASGVRVQDVDREKERRAAISDIIDEQLRGVPGVHRYERMFAPDEEMLSEEERQLMGLYTALTREASKGKEKAKPKKKGDLLELDLGL